MEETQHIPIFRACLHPQRLFGVDIPLLLPLFAMGMFYLLSLTQMTLRETLIFPLLIVCLSWLIKRYSASDLYWRQVMLRQYNYTKPWRFAPRYFPANTPISIELQHRKSQPVLQFALRGIGVVLLTATLLMLLYGGAIAKIFCIIPGFIGYAALNNASLSSGGLRPLHKLPWLDKALMR